MSNRRDPLTIKMVKYIQEKRKSLENIGHNLIFTRP